jgi:hypothetical protein
MRSIAGNRGFVFSGPYLPTAPGLYRVRVQSRVIDAGKQSYFDLFAAGRIYASSLYGDPIDIVAYISETCPLEFRFKADGEAFILDSIELTALSPETEGITPFAVPDWIWRPQVMAGEPLDVFEIARRLSASSRAQEAEDLLDRFVASRFDSGARIKAAFAGLHSGTNSRSCQSEPFLRTEIRQEVATWPIRVYDLFQLSEQDHLSLVEQDLQPAALLASGFHRSPLEPARPSQGGQDGEISAMQDRHALIEVLASLELSFQTSLCRGAGLRAYCPVTGRLLRSDHGYCQYASQTIFIFYYFLGAEPFYVCTGGYDGSRKFIYIPRKNIIVIIGHPYLRGLDYVAVTKQLCEDIIFHMDEVYSYLDDAPRPAALLGINNLGHFFWNELSGLQHLVSTGLHETLAEVVKVGRPYLEIERVFPELCGAEFVNITENLYESVFLHCLRRRLSPIYVTDVAMSEDLVRRVQSAAKATASEKGSPPPDIQHPLVWLNLRVHNKSWHNQAIGYTNILNALGEEFGQVSALLDGMPDCDGIAEQIRAGTGDHVRIYDNFDLGIADCINWALEVDAYVCTIGSGLVFLTWLTGKPGVAHANCSHMDQLSWWTDVRSDSPRPLAPHPSEIHSDDPLQGYCDYDLDWRILLDLLRNALGRG